jgi:geranyl-CoA carboxylase alpha subunit
VVEGASRALHRPFTSVLIANRGEIATRIAREARALNLRSIAVYSDADKRALHVEAADDAIHIGPAPARDSYLNADRILAAAKQTNAEAIHPGYGFLSENPDFAQAVIDAGLVWIGPSPDAIRAMGDKGAAKTIARKANVPVIPGYDGDDQSDVRLLAEAKKIGWPVLIKAAFGGGGRGQRRVTAETDFLDALASAKREALSAFASDHIILEKALDDVRHVEVQIFGDAQGNVIHLGERDCSIQRRNQKIIEEAPAPGVGEDLRKRMGEAAVRLARAVNYTNAGTVEYLLDRDGNFYFLEMNTRIQVEHPVTEEVTGANLIEWQFNVAKGKALPLKQSEVQITGHAIEARLYLEDPGDDFRPQTGKGWLYQGPDARCDSGVHGVFNATGHYDSMIAKVIHKGETRIEALLFLMLSLSDTRPYGIRSNRNLLVELLDHRDFRKGGVDIGWLSRMLPFRDEQLSGRYGRIAALALACKHGKPWRSTGPARAIVRLRERDKEATFVIEGDAIGELRVEKVDDNIRGIDGEAAVGLDVHLRDHGRPIIAHLSIQDRLIHVVAEDRDALFEDVTYAPAEPKGASGANVVRAPMAGRIVKVLAEPGAAVTKNQVLVILEAMKMEHELRAAADGVVETVTAKPGDQVAIRQVLVTLAAG